MIYFVFETFFSLLQGPTYTFDDRRTRHHACNTPLIPDPYEIGTIAIKKSKLHGSGEGVFLKVDVPAGRIVAFYNGVHKTELEIVSTILPGKYLIIFGMNNMSERNKKYTVEGAMAPIPCYQPCFGQRE